MLSDFFLKEESELFIGLLLLVFHKDRRVVNQLFHIILSAVANKTQVILGLIRLGSLRNQPLQRIVASISTFKNKLTLLINFVYA